MIYENLLEFMNDYTEKIQRNYTKRLEDEIIRFLRKNGYKPRKNEKYFINLNKKLRKKGLKLQIDTITNYNYKMNKAEIENKIYFKEL